MTDAERILKAKLFINHLIGRIISDADVGYYLGPFTRTEELLVEAAAALFDKRHDSIRASLRDVCHGRDADVVMLRERVAELEATLAEQGGRVQ